MLDSTAQPILRGSVYKQEVDHAESRPKRQRWVKVYCELRQDALVYFRTKDSRKPLDSVALDGDFLIKKVKAASNDKKEDKFSKKHLFFLTDFEHVHHYFAVSTSAIREKWTETLEKILAFHQEKLAKAMKEKQRKKSQKDQLKALQILANRSNPNSRTSAKYVQGVGLSKRDTRLLESLNEERDLDVEDLRLREAGWKEEALRLREELKEARLDSKRALDRDDLMTGGIKNLTDQLHDKEYQAEIHQITEFEQRQKIKALRKKIMEIDLQRFDGAYTSASESDSD